MLGSWRCALPGSEPHGIQLFRGDFNLNHLGLARLNRYSSFMIQRGLAHRLPAVSSAAAIHWLLLGCTAFMPPCSGVGKIICWWLDLRCIFAQCASSEVSMPRRNSQANFCAVCLGRCGVNCDEQGVVLNALSVSCYVFEFEARSSDWCRSSKSASARLRLRGSNLFDCISSPAHRQ